MPVVLMYPATFEAPPSFTLASITYPLDLVAGATGAWSLRKLAVAYAGNCLKVRRSSDDATLDIGFSGSYCDFAALSAFVGGGNGFVDTWYDQSGNSRNLTQATTGLQPQLLASGAYFTALGGYPSMQFTGTISQDVASTVNLSSFITSSNGTVFTLLHADAGAGTTFGRVVWGLNGNNTGFWLNSTPQLQAELYDTDYRRAAMGISLATGYVGVWRHNGSDATLKVYANSSTEGASVSVGTSESIAGPLRVGNNASGPAYDGRLTEVLCYNTALSSGDLGTIGAAMAVPFGLTWS